MLGSIKSALGRFRGVTLWPGRVRRGAKKSLDCSCLLLYRHALSSALGLILHDQGTGSDSERRRSQDLSKGWSGWPEDPSSFICNQFWGGPRIRLRAAAVATERPSRMGWSGIELYYTPGSPHCRSVLMCIKALNLDVDLTKIDMYQKFEHRKPWFVKVSMP